MAANDYRVRYPSGNACKVCGVYMPGSANGRPSTTCGAICRGEWKAARQRAQRSRTKALKHVGLALGALDQVRDPWKDQLRKFYNHLLEANPSELARPGIWLTRDW